MTAEDVAAALVYRIYDRGGRLIYVGASTNLPSRMHTHRSQSWWYALADRIETEPHPTPAEAFAAEAKIIRSEGPAFNLAHTGRRARVLTDEDVRVCQAWVGANHYEAGGERWRLGSLPVSLRWVADVQLPALAS